MDVSDLTIANPFVYFYFTLFLFLYIFIPNAIFIIYLIKSPDKDTFAYKRVRIIELGILLFSISIALDGLRFPSNIGILIIRIILMIGGLITMKGFLMKPPSELNIEYERRRIRIKTAEEDLKKALKIIAETNGIGELSNESKEKIKEMAKKIENEES